MICPGKYDSMWCSQPVSQHNNLQVVAKCSLKFKIIFSPFSIFFVWDYVFPKDKRSNTIIQWYKLSSLRKNNWFFLGTLLDIQGFIIIRDENTTLSRISDLAPKFLWDVTTHTLENEENMPEQVLICRKKFWAIIWGVHLSSSLILLNADTA